MRILDTFNHAAIHSAHNPAYEESDDRYDDHQNAGQDDRSLAATAEGFYAYAGATDHHLRLIRAHCPPSVAIKAAGGVRTLGDLLRVRELGVTRIGATTTEQILEEAKLRGYK